MEGLPAKRVHIAFWANFQFFSRIKLIFGRLTCFLLSSPICQLKAYPGFLGVLLLPPPPGWDACPSQGYHPALNSQTPIYTPGWERHCEGKVAYPRTQCPKPGLEPRLLTLGSRGLTMRPPHLLP